MVATHPLAANGPLLTALPDLLGFTPEDSWSVACLDPGARGYHGEAVLAVVQLHHIALGTDDLEGLVATLRAEGLIGSRLIPVAFLARVTIGQATPHADRLCRRLAREGIPAADIAWVRGLRWRSLRCIDPHCCPVHGRPLEVTGDGHRADIWVDSTGDVARRWAQTWGSRWTPDHGAVPSGAVEVAVAHAVTILALAAPVPEADLVLLAGGLHDVRVRDIVVWELVTGDPRRWPRCATTLEDALPRTPVEARAPAATLLGILRWQRGDPMGALTATGGALAGDPGYSLARLIRHCILRGVEPRAWAEGLRSMPRSALAGPLGFSGDGNVR